MKPDLFLIEKICCELAENIDPDFFSSSGIDKLVCFANRAWMPQIWLDYGEQLATHDLIVHPLTLLLAFSSDARDKSAFKIKPAT